MKKTSTPTNLPALLTVQQVAAATGLSERTIRRWIADGTPLKAHRIGPKCLRIERDSVLQLLGRPIGAA